MRPIDADKLKDFCAQWVSDEKDTDIKRAREIRSELFKAFIDIQETVDVVPVVHGEWIDFTMGKRGVPIELCGVCGKWSCDMAKHYCPHGGAKMDKENKNG